MQMYTITHEHEGSLFGIVAENLLPPQITLITLITRIETSECHKNDIKASIFFCLQVLAI